MSLGAVSRGNTLDGLGPGRASVSAHASELWAAASPRPSDPVGAGAYSDPATREEHGGLKKGTPGPAFAVGQPREQSRAERGRQVPPGGLRAQRLSPAGRSLSLPLPVKRFGALRDLNTKI